MSETILSLLQSIRSDVKQVDVISHNMANITTPGYKAIKSSSISFDALIANIGTKQVDSLIKTSWNLNKGELKATENPLDLAVQGDGFFVVRTDADDTPGYLRSISLKLSDDGYLMTTQGFLVESESGLIGFNGGNLVVDSSGKLYENGEYLATLKIVNIDSPSQIQGIHQGAFVTEQNNIQDASEFKIKQGYREQSNVDSSQQMIKLMELSKHIESTQRALTTVDQMLDIGINQIGQR